MKKNILTIDLEEWYHANYSLIKNKNRKSRIVQSTNILLQLLKKTKNKATFFVLGEVAEKNPNLIRKIARDGHEIASHGYNHDLVYMKSKEDFEKDLTKSIEIIETIIHKKVLGYRAPSWSVDKKRTPWFWDVLTCRGLKYSSSLFPFKTFLYGDNLAPRFPFKVNQKILEIPPSTLELFGKRVPFAGGFYFRLFPLCFIKWATNKINETKNPVVFYLHPREIDSKQYKLRLSLKDRFVHYYGIEKARKKFDNLLRIYKTISIRIFLGL